MITLAEKQVEKQAGEQDQKKVAEKSDIDSSFILIKASRGMALERILELL